MEHFTFINSLITDYPLLSAFLLGVFVVINPCSLAANISALAFLSSCENEEENKSIFKSGLLFTLGKSVAYFLLAVILYFFADFLDFGNAIQNVYTKLLGILFVVVGILMLDIIHIHGVEKKVLKIITTTNAFLVGIFLAYAFCPDGGIMYFGMLIPLSIREVSPIEIPFVFTLGTAIPILILTVIISKSVDKVKSFKQKLDGLYEVLRKSFGVLFIIIGTWLVVEYFFHHHDDSLQINTEILK